MKKFLKKASVYLLLMILISAVIFSLNYFLGKRISADIEAEIKEYSQSNNYELRFLSVESNPLLREINITNLNLSKPDNFNLNLNQAEINFSWQQILNYIREGHFRLDENLKSQIAQINYSNLKDNYQLNLDNSSLAYSGNLQKLKNKNIENFSDLNILMDNNHQFDFKSQKVKFDFPYYRSYGLNKEDWNQLSTFNDFTIKGNYNKNTNQFNLDEFNLSGEILKIIFDLNTALEYKKESDKLAVNKLDSNYDFLLAAEKIDFKANSYFDNLAFKQFDFSGSLNLAEEDKKIKINNFDFAGNLSKFKLTLSKELSQQLNQNTFGILEEKDKFNLTVDKLSYKQKYSHPSGSSQAELNSSLIEAVLDAEYNYSNTDLHINSASLKYKTKTAAAERLNSFLQLVLGSRFTKNEDGFYVVEIWGPISSLNFK